MCEPTPLPKSGTQAVRFKAVTTQHLVLRGWFQTLPIAVYGQKLGPDPAQQARCDFPVLLPIVLGRSTGSLYIDVPRMTLCAHAKHCYQ